jgi:hypothetical protein
MKRRYSEPVFMAARFNSKCHETGKEIKKGDSFLYAYGKAYHTESKYADQIRGLHATENLGLADGNW